MDFGMPVLLELDTLEQNAALCRELGLSFVELNMNLPQYQLGEMKPKKLRDVAQMYGVYFTLHLDENLNVWDFNPAVAKAYFDTLLHAVKFAGEMGNIPVLNMHMSPGVHFTLPDRKVYLFEKYRESYWQRLFAFRSSCEKAVGDLSVRICMENTSGYPDFLREAVSYLLESHVFSLTWDVGHDHACGEKDREFILNRWERVSHFHLHDALGREDHLPLGQGEIDLKEKIGLAQLCGARCVVEVKTAQTLRRSIDYLKSEMEVCSNS